MYTRTPEPGLSYKSYNYIFIEFKGGKQIIKAWSYANVYGYLLITKDNELIYWNSIIPQLNAPLRDHNIKNRYILLQNKINKTVFNIVHPTFYFQ